MPRHRLPRFGRFAPPALLALLVTVVLFGSQWLRPIVRAAAPDGALPPIVFVARAHLATPDFIFTSEVGPAGQFGTGLAKFAPGSRLVRRDADGTLFVYSTPGLVDVQSPDVNFDATRIVFAGATTLDSASLDYGWRLYEINVDGSGFRQLTFSDRAIAIPNADQFLNGVVYGRYDDLFPAYLADGRIVFVSTRYPTRSHYDHRPSTNIYIVDGDGNGLRRVSTERAGLLHPTPLPDGRILLTRWWNQFNQPGETGVFNRIDNSDVDQILPDGTVISANPNHPFNPPEGYLSDGYPIRGAPNTWHLMTINPDGTDFQRFAWTPAYGYRLTDDSGLFDTYAAAQPAPVFANGRWYVAYTSQQDSTMVHSTLKTGIRVALPGVEMITLNTTDAIAGLTYEKAWNQGDESGPYALHPWGLPDGRLLYSQSGEDNSLPTSGTYSEGGESYSLQGSNLRYELFVMDLDGANKTAVNVDLNAIGLGTADMMDAKSVVARNGWAAVPDAFTSVANDDPHWGNVPSTLPEYAFSQNGSNDIETATIHNPNVYANAPLTLPYVNNSPPPGSVATAQVWIDANQFTGAVCYPGNGQYPDYPQPCDDFRRDVELRAVLWTEVPVTLSGAFTTTIPADTMGFIVLRDGEGRALRGWNRGYISIAQGSAWARPGEIVTCTGCHMGHVSGSIDSVEAAAEAGWTNLAPYATVLASSWHKANNDPYKPFIPQHVNDRRGWVPVPGGWPGTQSLVDSSYGWISAPGQASGEWLDLTWPAAMTITAVNLVGPPPLGGDWGGFGAPLQYGDYYVDAATLTFYLDGAQTGAAVLVGRIEPLSNGGTLVILAEPIRADRLRLTIDATTGRWWHSHVAALNEIEVIGQAAEWLPPAERWASYLPAMQDAD